MSWIDIPVSAVAVNAVPTSNLFTTLRDNQAGTGGGNLHNLTAEHTATGLHTAVSIGVMPRFSADVMTPGVTIDLTPAVTLAGNHIARGGSSFGDTTRRQHPIVGAFALPPLGITSVTAGDIITIQPVARKSPASWALRAELRKLTTLAPDPATIGVRHTHQVYEEANS